MRYSSHLYQHRCITLNTEEFSVEIRTGVAHDPDSRAAGIGAAVAIASPPVHAAIGNGVSTDWRGALSQATGAPAISAYVNGDTALSADLKRSGTSLFALIIHPGNTRSASSMGYELLEAFKSISLGRIPVFGGAAADMDDFIAKAGGKGLRSPVQADGLATSGANAPEEVSNSISCQ